MNHNSSFSFYKLSPWVDIKKLNWFNLSRNPNAIHLLEQNQDKIDWYMLSRNPSIFTFTYNYSEIKKRMKVTIAEDLMKNRFHPKHMDKWIRWGVKMVYLG